MKKLNDRHAEELNKTDYSDIEKRLLEATKKEVEDFVKSSLTYVRPESSHKEMNDLIKNHLLEQARRYCYDDIIKGASLDFDIDQKKDVITYYPNNLWTALLIMGVHAPWKDVEDKDSYAVPENMPYLGGAIIHWDRVSREVYVRPKMVAKSIRTFVSLKKPLE